MVKKTKRMSFTSADSNHNDQGDKDDKNGVQM